MNPVAVIANFSRLGEALKRTGTFMEVAKQIAGIAEMAEATVMQEAGDWFDGHTVKRNMSELKKHAGSFVKLAQEMDMMQQRSTALYDDMGNVLSRYFEMSPLQDAMPTGDIGGGQAQGMGGALPGDDEEEDEQGGMLDDGGYGGFDFNGDDDEEEDETVETIVDSVMDRILPDKGLEEKGEETEFRARKALRTPHSISRGQQGFTHDQALEILRRLNVKNVDEARQVFSRISEMMQVRAEGGPGSGPQSHGSDRKGVADKWAQRFSSDKTQLTPAAERVRAKEIRNLKRISKNEGYPKKHKGRRKWGSKKRQAAKNRKKIRQKHK
ncbi:hypothetical protein LCGC14_1033570 [marine sediment metagenome]|uniref:Uncharacterized protein n=1 Tax=marine sediment metagenome TaxID=412755 RepID=A0A0F9MTV7_9ZZZZ